MEQSQKLALDSEEMEIIQRLVVTSAFDSGEISFRLPLEVLELQKKFISAALFILMKVFLG